MNTKLHRNLALIDQRRSDWEESVDLSMVTNEALLDELEDRFKSDEDIRRLLEIVGAAI